MGQQGTEPAREPWLRGSRQETPAIARAVLHALDLAREDFARWAWTLRAAELDLEPFGLPSVGFQGRHIARSLDRLLTYAEGHSLISDQQLLLHTERDSQQARTAREEFESSLHTAEMRILNLPLNELDHARYVGRALVPVTLGGLLIHLADHTQRHAGQAVTTAKVLRALEHAEQS